MREEGRQAANRPGPGFNPPPQAMRAQTEGARMSAYDAARLEVKEAVEEWFSNVSLDDLFMVKGWSQGAPTKSFDNDKHYDQNGDMIAKADQVFRQVGWQINGGVNDGLIVTEKLDESLREASHGGYSPVYVEVGTD